MYSARFHRRLAECLAARHIYMLWPRVASSDTGTKTTVTQIHARLRSIALQNLRGSGWDQNAASDRKFMTGKLLQGCNAVRVHDLQVSFGDFAIHFGWETFRGHSLDSHILELLLFPISYNVWNHYSTIGRTHCYCTTIRWKTSNHESISFLILRVILLLTSIQCS